MDAWWGQLPAASIRADRQVTSRQFRRSTDSCGSEAVARKSATYGGSWPRVPSRLCPR